MEKISPNDKKRILRVLEIYKATGKNKTEQEKESRKNGVKYDYKVFAINWEREQLYERINKRVDIMIEQGLIQEVEQLLEKYSEFPTAMQGLGYKEVVEYLQGQTTREEMIEKIAERKYPSIAYELAAQIQEKTNQEVRITVPGHMQRGGSPCAYDRVLSTRLGAAAADLILNKEYGYMVGIKNDKTVKVPLEEVAGKLKMVDPDAKIIKEAKLTGISFGDK